MGAPASLSTEPDVDWERGEREVVNFMKIKHPYARFVWLVGAIHEEMPDVPAPDGENELRLWDRQEKQAVMTIHNPYAQAMCLETTNTLADMPFTTLENWFNHLDNKALKSENLPMTRLPFKTGRVK